VKVSNEVISLVTEICQIETLHGIHKEKRNFAPFNIIPIPKSIKEHVYKPVLRFIRRQKIGEESIRSDSIQVDSNIEGNVENKKVSFLAYKKWHYLCIIQCFCFIQNKQGKKGEVELNYQVSQESSALKIH
jgi:hypothetical protein